MELRVDEREWIQFQWPYLLAFLGGEQRVTELAYATGAFVRRREIESPSEMLQLLFTWQWLSDRCEIRQRYRPKREWPM